MPFFAIKIICNTEVEEEPTESDELERSSALSIPVALPLKRMSARKSIRRHEDYWAEKGKDTKISKIFQLTVTALSFLAFGGYLMTLTIMAIRRNQNNVAPGNVIVFSVKKIVQLQINRGKKNLLLAENTCT